MTTLEIFGKGGESVLSHLFPFLSEVPFIKFQNSLERRRRGRQFLSLLPTISIHSTDMARSAESLTETSDYCSELNFAQSY